MIILPRQARDKHRETTQKEMSFSQNATHPGVTARLLKRFEVGTTIIYLPRGTLDCLSLSLVYIV
jgi:hypothetical protein